jgi:Family of unknown function (DUF5336)
MVPAGVRTGTHTGGVAVRGTGRFGTRTPHGLVQDIRNQYFRLLQRVDGYTCTTKRAGGATSRLEDRGSAPDTDDDEIDKGSDVNNRSLTRGDAVVIGAAVVLFIASFLDFYESQGDLGGLESKSAWSNYFFPALFSIFLAGIIAAGLIAAARFLPQEKRLLGLKLDQWGMTLGVFAAWTALWTIFAEPFGAGEDLEVGAGQILGFVFSLVLAGGAVATPLVPALQTPLLPEGTLRTGQGRQPYDAGPQPGYGYPGGPQQVQPQSGYGYPVGPQPGQPGPGPQGPQQSSGGQPQQQSAQAQPAAAADPNFQPFWFAVPVTRPLFGEDGSSGPVAELAPGTWYLAVEQRGQALLAQTQDGRRGLLQDTSGIQRG